MATISSIAKPNKKPGNPYFGSGPSTKRPGWSPLALSDALVGRSHRGKDSVKRIQDMLQLGREILNIPASYKVAIVPGSDTGAMEMAMWSLLGPRGVDVISYDRFGQLWLYDLQEELKLKDLRIFSADYGDLPDLKQIDPGRDTVFCWTGTTSGVAVPHGEWIAADRLGLTICDATASAFAVDLPWNKLDVTTYSWQKVLGGEAGFGVIVLSPRAVERLVSYTPSWPMPRLFRLMKDHKINEEIFLGQTINTPSMLCIEDCYDALKWIKSAGGLPFMIQRSQENLQIVAKWVEANDWVDFMADEPSTRASTAICLRLVEPGYREMPDDAAYALARGIADLLAQEKVAFDIMGHREAPPNLRVWGGGMVEPRDIELLLPWIEWARSQVLPNITFGQKAS